MASKTPVLLVDNVYDRINQYTSAVMLSSGDIVGREPQYVADYRRERTYWQAATAAVDRYVGVDIGVGNSVIVDACWIDRGHNLWGKTVQVESSTNAFAASDTRFAVVPASGTVGGDPTTGWCVTEEGAIYMLFAVLATGRYFRVRCSDNWQPIIPGIILGARTQLLGYSSVIDEDAGERFERSEQSLIPGYSGDDRTYSARKVDLDLKLIGATEYDGSIRTLRRLLFDRNQPAIVCTNYGTKPERTWLYKYKGAQWSSPMSRTYRSAKISLYEYGPLIR